MKKLKGIKKLNKAISKELKPFGIPCAFMGTEYQWYIDTDKIEFKITENEIGDQLFVDFIKDYFGYDVEYSFIISLLHEVGHSFTYNNLDDEEINFCDDEKERIDKEMEKAKTYEDVKELMYQYFTLPDEIVATEWAVNFAENNPQLIEKMWRKCYNALGKFYEDNDLFEDDED